MRITSEQDLPEFYHQHIQPFWQQQVQLGKFAGVAAVPIHYAYVVHPQAAGAVVISSGRIEGLVKYKEVVYDLYHNGYSVFIHDHRGQGESGRMTVNPHKGYVESFDDFVADMRQFYQQVVQPHCDQTPHLLCHSMGSAIGALYVMANPTDFDRVAFSAPMFGIRPVVPGWLINPLLIGFNAVNRLFSDQAWYFPGQGDYQPAAFDDNVLTHSQQRYQIFRDEYEQHPANKLGGVTGRWLAAAYDAMDRIQAGATGFPIPVLHLQASADVVVDNAQQSRVCTLFPDCTSIAVSGAFHELLMEADSARTPCMQEILTFFSQQQDIKKPG